MGLETHVRCKHARAQEDRPEPEAEQREQVRNDTLPGALQQLAARLGLGAVTVTVTVTVTVAVAVAVTVTVTVVVTVTVAVRMRARAAVRGHTLGPKKSTSAE